MMIPIYTRNDTKARHRRRLLISRKGITMTYERSAYKGGYYISNSVHIPWPWVKIS